MANLVPTEAIKVPALNPGDVAELRELEISQDDMVFVSQYVATGDAGVAFASVFQCNKAAANRLGMSYLTKPKIQKAISIFYKKIGEALLLDTSVIFAKTWEIANDPRAKNSDKLRALEMLDKMIKQASGEQDSRDNGPVVNVIINTDSGSVTAEPKMKTVKPDPIVIDPEKNGIVTKD